MEPLKTFLIAAVVLIPVFYALWYFGIAVTRAGFSWFHAGYSLPARWEGTLSDASGLMGRNFVVFRKYSALSIEIETNSGAMQFQVKTSDGRVLSPASGSYGADARVLFDLSAVRRCRVQLQAAGFSGAFRITLQ